MYSVFFLLLCFGCLQRKGKERDRGIGCEMSSCLLRRDHAEVVCHLWEEGGRRHHQRQPTEGTGLGAPFQANDWKEDWWWRQPLTARPYPPNQRLQASPSPILFGSVHDTSRPHFQAVSLFVYSIRQPDLKADLCSLFWLGACSRLLDWLTASRDRSGCKPSMVAISTQNWQI